MEQSRKFTIALFGLLALMLAVALSAGMWGRATVFAAQNSQAPEAASIPAAAATPAASDPAQKLMDTFMAHFTSRLGTDETRLNAAFQGAVNDTADQAVQDGTITQAQADEARTMVQKEGVRGFLEGGLKAAGAGKAGPSTAEEQANPKKAIMDTMNSFGISLSEIQQGVDSGKSLVEIAQAHNISAETLKSAILTRYKAELDALVSGGTMTQAQADQEYQGFSGAVDDIINGKGGNGTARSYRTQADAVTEAAEYAAWNAAPALLHLQAADMKARVASGKSITDLAHAANVDPQTVRTAMLNAGKAPIDAAVSAKTLTQAQADEHFRNLTAWVDTLMSVGQR